MTAIRKIASLALLAAALMLTACGGGAAGAPYAPVIVPSNFTTVIDNPFFPLTPGATHVYEGTTPEGTERTENYVTFETKQVMGVTCIVLKNRVTLNGALIEETFDWHAQDKDGNVWYFGEDAKDYEGGKVVSTAGSWEAGRDGAMPGTIMKASPKVGDIYKQEYYKGHAEDTAEVLDLTGQATVPYGSYTGVLVTKDWTPLDDTVIENKYFARGIGLVLEDKVKGGSGRSELIAVTRGN
jgi:hypothetical protein